MSNVTTTPGVLTLDTAAVISATNKFVITQIVYAAPAAAVGEATIKDGAGRLIGTLRAAVSGTAILDFGSEGKGFIGFELATITAASNMTVYCK